MRLNDKGQCPACLIKPTTYKRDRKHFCTRCDRTWSLDTGEFLPNFAWLEPNTPTKHHLYYGEPIWLKPVYWTNENLPLLKLPSAMFYADKKRKHIKLINHNVPVGDPRQNEQYEKWMEQWEHHEV